MVAAVVPAAGSGSRFGTPGGKTLIPLAGRPLIVHTLARLRARAAPFPLVVGVPPDSRAEFAALFCDPLLTFVDGGATRQETVRRCLDALPAETQWVLVHDGARPLVTPALRDRVLAAAQKTGAAAPALPLTDSLRRMTESGSVSLDRSGTVAVQTPQAFRADLLRAAHAQAGRATATDDASLVERLGAAVTLVPGDPANLKVTTPDDLALAERLLERHTTRTGIGFDVHRIAAGRPLMLGGVRLESDFGLDGHSDADVIAHAICDALLGAVAAGDLGRHFPPGDPQWAGAPGVDLLRRVCDLVEQAGGEPVSVDATLIAEAPRIAPHADAMRAALSGALRLTPACVSIKATTAEGLGFIGRREGMACYAVATVRTLDPAAPGVE